MRDVNYVKYVEFFIPPPTAGRLFDSFSKVKVSGGAAVYRLLVVSHLWLPPLESE